MIKFFVVEGETVRLKLQEQHKEQLTIRCGVSGKPFMPLTLCKSVIHDENYCNEYAGFKFDYVLHTEELVDGIEMMLVEVPLDESGLEIIKKVIPEDDPILEEILAVFSMYCLSRYDRKLSDQLLEIWRTRDN